MKLKRTTFILLIILSLVLVFCLIGCERTHKDSHTVMVMEGEGYTVVGESIVEVKRNEKVEFKIEISEGYGYGSSFYGEYKDGIFTVDKVKYDMSILLDVRKIATVSIDSREERGTVEIKSERNDGVFLAGDKVEVVATPKVTFNAGGIIFQDVKQPTLDGDQRSKSATIELHENNNIEVDFIGDAHQLMLIASDGGELKVTKRNGNAVASNEIYRYGDEIEFYAKAYDGHKISFWNKNGIFEMPKNNKEDTIKIIMDGMFDMKAEFCLENAPTVKYDANGGEFIDGGIQSLQYNVGGFFNINNCFNKLKYAGKTLIGLNEVKNGGSDTSHSLGAMLQMPANGLTLYAEWADWSSDSFFEFEEKEDGYAIKNLTESGKMQTKIVIPGVYNNKPVIEINKTAFSNNSVVQEVILNPNMKNLYQGNFSNCSSLKQVIIFENVNTELDVFKNCDNLQTLLVNATTLPDYIDKYAATISHQYVKFKNDKSDSRMLFIGGSNVKHGVKGERIANELNVKPYIFSNNSATVSNFLISLVMNHVKDKDVVVLMPEYSREMYFNYEYTFVHYLVVKANYDMLREINLKDYKSFINGTLDIIQRSKTAFAGIDNTNEHHNEYGAWKRYSHGRDDSWVAVGNIYIEQRFLLTEESIKNLRYQTENFHAKGARVYFSFPSANRNALVGAATNIEERKAFVQSLQNSIGDICPIISDMEKNIFSGTYFFDTNWHLSTDGAIIRTNQLIADLNIQFQKEGIVS